MALNLGRGTVQELGTNQSNVLLGQMQNLQQQRTADARATAGLELKRMQEEADAMGISMGRYVERNADRFRGAMQTLYGGGRNGASRAETSYQEVLGGPETKEQLERYKESEYYREFGRPLDWAADPNAAPQTGGGQSPADGGAAPTEKTLPSITYTNDAGDEITEAMYNDQQGSYEKLLDEGDPAAAFMVKQEDRDAMLGWLEEQASTGSTWAKQKLEDYKNAAEDGLQYSQPQNGIMTSVIKELRDNPKVIMGGQSTGGGASPMESPESYMAEFQRLIKLKDENQADTSQLKMFWNDMNELTPDEQQKAMAYLRVKDDLNIVRNGRIVNDPTLGFNEVDIRDIRDKSPTFDQWPTFVGDANAVPTPPEMRLRGFNRNETTPEAQAAPTPTPTPAENRQMYFGDLEKFDENFQQATGSELNRTNQQLTAARQNVANVVKTQAETDYLRAKEDSEYAGVELAYNSALADLQAGSTPENKVETDTAIAAIKSYNELLQQYGAPPASRSVAGLQQYVDGMNKKDREAYNSVMGGFADQVLENKVLSQYFEVVPVYSTSGAATRAASGTPSGGDERRSRTVRLVLPRMNNYVATTSDDIKTRLTTATD